MRRIRLTTGPAAIFGAVFVIALIVLLPMRLALGAIGVGDQGLTARAVDGSVWSGAVREAQVGRIALGDLGVAVSPLALLAGRARIDLAGHATDLGGSVHGAIEMSRHSVGLDRMSASLPAGNIFAPVPISALDLDAVDVKFDGGRCQRASGRVNASLSGEVAGISLAEGMAGEARCGHRRRGGADVAGRPLPRRPDDPVGRSRRRGQADAGRISAQRQGIYAFDRG
jgi:general secretion pathway protein N